MPILSKINIPKADLEKMVLIAIAAFIVVFSLIQFGIIPSFRTLGKLDKDIRSGKDALEKARTLVANKSQLQARLSSMQDKRKEFEKELPPYREMPNILQRISEAAEKNKIKIIKMEPLRAEKAAETAKYAGAKQGAKAEASKKPKAIYVEIPIQVEARGGYHAIGEFINSIETSDNVMSIGDIDITSNPDDIQSHNARFLIIAYLLREETPSK